MKILKIKNWSSEKGYCNQAILDTINSKMSNEEVLAIELEAYKPAGPVFVVDYVVREGYDDISSIKNWNDIGKELLGSTVGLKDWKSIQREIKVLAMAKTNNDLNANFNNLDEEEKVIVANYLLNKLSTANLVAAFKSNDIIGQSIKFDFLNCEAREKRLAIVRSLLIIKIGIDNAKQIFDEVLNDQLLDKYIGGTEGKEEDNGKVGLYDYILSRGGTPYFSTGLSEKNFTILDGSGDTLQQVCEQIITILRDGTY